jgi:FkbM family methyltransferase
MTAMRHPAASPLTLLPPKIQSTTGSRAAHRLLAKHADAPGIRLLRRVVEAVVQYLHSEDHDPCTNGEFRLVRVLRDRIAVAVDAGANHGLWAKEVLRAAPNAHVICYEIASPTRLLLSRNLESYSAATIVPAGLASVGGETEITYHAADDRWTSRFRYPHPGRPIALKELVVRGDDEMLRLGIEKVDLLKVDTEGADFDVLCGWKGALEAGAIRVLQFEYGYACVLARVFLLDFYELLVGCGYLVGRLTPRGVNFSPYRLEDENFFGPNFVAVRADDGEILALLDAWRNS